LIEAIDSPEGASDITLNDLSLELGKPINTQLIIQAEKALVWRMKKKGYALCQVLKKECVANIAKHSLSVTVIVMPCQKIFFRPTSIGGNDTVLSKTIEKHIMWREAELFDPTQIEKTQSSLEKTGLFSSVFITSDEEKIENQRMPIHVNVQESK